jgi:hypothetical protein
MAGPAADDSIERFLALLPDDLPLPADADATMRKLEPYRTVLKLVLWPADPEP